MTFADDPEFMRRLELHEGFLGHLYRDTVGKTTIGFGRNLDDNPLTLEEARYLTRGPIAEAERNLDRSIPWWRHLDVPRQRVLVDMAYNMGWGNGNHGLSSFSRTLEFLHRGDYVGAAAGMRASKWYRQVGSRAIFLANVMEHGTWPESVLTS